MKTILLGISFACLLFSPGSDNASAQSSPPAKAADAKSETPFFDAQLQGTLLDISGRALSDVQIAARPAADSPGRSSKTVSDADGAYSLALPPGKYRLTFQHPGFVTREVAIELHNGAAQRVDLRMLLEPVSSRVLVTAESTPSPVQQTSASVTTVSRQEIDQRLSVTLPDALLYTPGVAIGRTGPEGGSASIFLGGGNSAFTKVLVDGTPVNEPGNAVDFSNFTLDNIDKVEVVRGAESAIYGTDAVSGVIQVFTHRGTTRTPEVVMFAEGGTFGTGRGGAQFSGLLGNFDYSAAASYFSTDGPENENHFLNRTLSGNFGYRLGEDNQLRLTLRNNTSSAQTPGEVLLEPPSPDSHTDYHFFSSNLRWDFATGKHWHHQLMGAESYNRQFTADPVQSFYATDPIQGCPKDPSSPNSVATKEFCDFTDPGSRYQYNRASLNAQSSYVLQNFAGTAGYQYEVENAHIPFLSAGHVRRNNQGGFLDFRYSPAQRFSLTFGVRAEANQNFGTRVVPRAGASFLLLQSRGFRGDTRIRAFYGQGIKEPRFDQLYNDNFGDLGNPALKPESSKTWSAGLEQKLWNDRLIFNGEYFYNRFYNLISFAFCFPELPPATGNTCGLVIPGAPPSFGYYFNTDRARARGTNISAEAKINRWLKLTGSYSYDDSLVLAAPNALDPSEVAGNRLIRRPVNSGSFSAFAGWHRASFAVSGYFTGARTDTDFLQLGLNHTPGYARIDLAAAYQISHGVSAYVRTANLLDKFYQDVLGFPALGREVRVGMNYRFGGKS